MSRDADRNRKGNASTDLVRVKQNRVFHFAFPAPDRQEKRDIAPGSLDGQEILAGRSGNIWSVLSF